VDRFEDALAVAIQQLAELLRVAMGYRP